MLLLKESLKIRKQRNKLLDETSVYSLADVYEELTIEQKSELKIYKQALRSLPQKQFVMPEVKSFEDIQWPEKPSWMSSVSNAINEEDAS